jgi:hypothetical protein
MSVAQTETNIRTTLWLAPFPLVSALISSHQLSPAVADFLVQRLSNWDGIDGVFSALKRPKTRSN